jgi:DNA-binding GntR family transcriptional regulator
MTILPRHQTKAELALHVLREKIRMGELEPGQRVRVTALQDELGMSPTPIREALRLLQADGLISYRPHQQIVVAESSPEETIEIFRLRSLLEPLATQLAGPRLRGKRLKELERRHEKLLEGVERGASISISNADWHWAIYEASGWVHLTDFIRRLWERFPWRTMWVLPDRAHMSAAEHDAVMEGIRAGDSTLAAEQMRAHIESGCTTLLTFMNERHAADGDGAVEWPSAR